jgi:hypothetical protein
MKHVKIAFFIFTLALIITVSCKKETLKTDFATCTTPTYEGEIKTLIATNCNDIDCHGGRQQPVLTYYTAVKAAVDNGTFEYEVITSRAMPLGSKLSQEDFDLINCWLSDGAPEKSE